jgi:hypothetical protein
MPLVGLVCLPVPPDPGLCVGHCRKVVNSLDRVLSGGLVEVPEHSSGAQGSAGFVLWSCYQCYRVC